MTTTVVFLDCETVCLAPAMGSVWEVAAIVRTSRGDLEYCWQVHPDMTLAEPEALTVSGYYQRSDAMTLPSVAKVVTHPRISPGDFINVRDAARDVARLLCGAVVVGSNPDFDRGHVGLWLAQHGESWAAHYRAVDVITMAAGFLAAGSHEPTPAPFPVRDISRSLGVDPDDYERHTALGDCRWVRDMWDRMGMGDDR